MGVRSLTSAVGWTSNQRGCTWRARGGLCGDSPRRPRLADVGARGQDVDSCQRHVLVRQHAYDQDVCEAAWRARQVGECQRGLLSVPADPGPEDPTMPEDPGTAAWPRARADEANPTGKIINSRAMGPSRSACASRFLKRCARGRLYRRPRRRPARRTRIAMGRGFAPRRPASHETNRAIADRDAIATGPIGARPADRNRIERAQAPRARFLPTVSIETERGRLFSRARRGRDGRRSADLARRRDGAGAQGVARDLLAQAVR